jgi:hypothetical protein
MFRCFIDVLTGLTSEAAAVRRVAHAFRVLCGEPTT